MLIATRTVAKAKMSININGFQIPFENAPDSMQRFVRPAIFSTEDEIYELQKIGTALLCQYHGLSLAITTQHQTGTGGLGKPLAEKFVVMAEKNSKKLAVPPTAIYTPKIDDENFQSLNDLQLYDYHNQFADHSIQALNLRLVLWSDSQHAGRDYSFVVGYPTESHIIKLVDDEDVGARVLGYVSQWIRQDLQADTEQKLDKENRNIFIKHLNSTRMSINPDGLSGAPVFSIVKDSNNDRHLLFEGLVTDAKDDRFAVYPSQHIKRALDQIADQSALS